MSVAKRLSNISLEDNFSISSVLSAVPTKSLIELYLADNRGVERNENWKKNDLKKLIVPSITTSAVKYVVENMTIEQLQAALAPLKIDHAKKRNNPNSRKVLSKRLTEALTTQGIAEFLEKHAELALLKGIAEGLELAVASSKADLINQITEAAEAEGLRVYFESFSEEVLRDVAFDMKLEKDPLALTGKTVLVECILHNTEVPEKQKKKEKVKLSKTKPALKKGVTYENVFQHYNVDELHDWCKKSGLKTSGNKPELIRRILAFFDGEKENIMAGQRKAPKRRKSTVPKKAKKVAPKKDEDEDADEEEVVEPPKAKKNTPAKSAPKPVEEEKVVVEDEAEEEVVEEDEEAADDLDLDNLESHSLAELKKYCEEEEIKVKGTKKADYVAAIQAYNEEAGEDEDEDEEEH